MRRQKRFALLVVFTVGTSLGSAATVLGVVRAYLWTPLPYPDAARLATVNVFTMDVPVPRHLNTMDWSVRRQVADLVVAWDIDGFTLLGGDRPETASGRWITADVFPMFGITPIAGRAFAREEERAGTPVAMIGHRLWQTRFGGSTGLGTADGLNAAPVRCRDATPCDPDAVPAVGRSRSPGLRRS